MYHPPSKSGKYYFDNLDKSLDIFSNYEQEVGGDLSICVVNLLP